QNDHLHLLVEADDERSLARGMQGLLSGLARVVNRTTGNVGRLWSDRYHSRPLRTPTEVRHCIIYVLRNSRKHSQSETGPIDPLSSGAWFDGFEGGKAARQDDPPVVPPESWLLKVGWQRAGGPIRDDERPVPPK